jgi:hypothetical protein
MDSNMTACSSLQMAASGTYCRLNFLEFELADCICTSAIVPSRTQIATRLAKPSVIL